MYADIEALVLSGEFFNGPERSSSPARSLSPDAGWHDDELSAEAQKHAEKGLDYDSDDERRDAFRAAQQKQGESIGMGPGRTGVKGVIRDRDEAEGMEREKRAREVDEVRLRMERSNLGGRTFLEEEREKVGKVDELVMREREKTAEEREDMFGRKKDGRFGHLREVGVKGFVSAVEKEDRGVWVVVHLYEPSLERCYHLDDTLARLARLYPSTKFIRSRAAALGFASKPSSSARPRAVAPARRSKISRDDDEDDPYGDDEDDERSPVDDDDDDDVDLDVLPTMLVYRDGELVHNWVRVDWEAGQAGVEELLDQHHILPRSESLFGSGNLGLPSDGEDEFDLIWSDDENEKH